MHGQMAARTSIARSPRWVGLPGPAEESLLTAPKAPAPKIAGDVCPVLSAPLERFAVQSLAIPWVGKPGPAEEN